MRERAFQVERTDDAVFGGAEWQATTGTGTRWLFNAAPACRLRASQSSQPTGSAGSQR